MSYTIGKLLTRAKTLLETSPQLEVCTRSYGPPKLWKSQFLEFWDFQFGCLGTKWHLGVGPVAKHRDNYKGEGVASPKSEPWWVLWVYVCLWLVCAPKVFQLRTNQLVVWFVRVCVSNWLACHFSEPLIYSSGMPLLSIKEFGGASFSMMSQYILYQT